MGQDGFEEANGARSHISNHHRQVTQQVQDGVLRVTRQDDLG